MSDESYIYIKLTGRLKDGHDMDKALEILSRVFHIPKEKGRDFFQGTPTTIKKKLPPDAAKKVLAHLKRAGVEAEGESPEDELELSLELIEDTTTPPAPETTTVSDEVPEEEDADTLEEEHSAPKIQKKEPQDYDLIPMEKERAETANHKTEEYDNLIVENPYQAGDQENEDNNTQPPPPPGSESDSVESHDDVDMMPQPTIAFTPPRPDYSEVVNEDEFADESLPASTDAHSHLPLIPLIGGVLLITLAIASYFLFFSEEPAPAPVTVQPPPNPPKNPNQIARAKPTAEFAESEQSLAQLKLQSLAKNVKLWMIQFGGNNDSRQVNIDRLIRDIGVTEADLTDPWGSRILYQPTDDGFIISSPGPDKQPGTADDIQLKN